MKNRVTLFLEDKPYRLLRVMSAEDNTSMSDIVEKLVMGDVNIVSDPKERKKWKKEYEQDTDTSEITYDFHEKKMVKSSVK